jgi:Choline/Carnitine o-acyltransferase
LDTVITIVTYDRKTFIVQATELHFFQLNVFDSSGEPLSAAKIEWQLQKIVEKSKTIGRGSRVGVLTSEHRDKVITYFFRLHQGPEPGNEGQLTIFRSIP